MDTFSVAQIRSIEQKCINTLGVEETVLMERAGQSALDCLKEHWPQARHITVICGGGNNGGDGFVFARLAHRKGLHVIVQMTTDLNDLKGVALKAAKACQASGVVMRRWHDHVLRADVIVDALLGIGLQGPLRDAHAALIASINDAACDVLSIDVPSGVNADTGEVHSLAVDADVTATFIGVKRGLVTGDALSYIGTLDLYDLDLPPAAMDDVNPVALTMNYQHFARDLMPRKRAAHKGDFGHVLVIGGDHGFYGAPLMAAIAAARSGAGLVSVATRYEAANSLNAMQPEIMMHAVDDAKGLRPLLERATVIVLGPGLGQSKWSRALFKAALSSKKPMVIDADALNFLAKKPMHNHHWILTPHPGEAARLLQLSNSELQADRFRAAQHIQKTYGGAVVLKGAGTVIDTGEIAQTICCEGNPGMATGGMGDVLSGIIGALLAQGFSLDLAAKLGVSLHARAGDLASSLGERGLLASDLFPAIRELVNP